jgi:hypothetical protein
MEPQKKRRKARGRVEGNAFMDSVRAAFIRWVALEKWRELEDLQTSAGLDLGQAIDEAGIFFNRGRYQHIWTRRWKTEVRPEMTGTEPGDVFSAIERAVAAALQEEEVERSGRGDRALQEDPEYKRFVDTALEGLLRAQADQLEPNREK